MRGPSNVSDSAGNQVGAGLLQDKAAKMVNRHAWVLSIAHWADDYRSQPAGDAGDRIACAVIERVG